MSVWSDEMNEKTAKRRPKRHGRKAAPEPVRHRKQSPEQIVEEVRAIVREVAALPILHDVDADEWLYDDHGLPH